MSINDASLAEVWPKFSPDPGPTLNRQYLYANIIYQYTWTSLNMGNYTDDEAVAALRYLFTSPVIRDYWKAAEKSRKSLAPGTAEFNFAKKADLICHEYQAVIESSHPSAEATWALRSERPGVGPKPDRRPAKSRLARFRRRGAIDMPPRPGKG